MPALVAAGAEPVRCGVPAALSVAHHCLRAACQWRPNGLRAAIGRDGLLRSSLARGAVARRPLASAWRIEWRLRLKERRPPASPPQCIPDSRGLYSWPPARSKAGRVPGAAPRSAGGTALGGRLRRPSEPIGHTADGASGTVWPPGRLVVTGRVTLGWRLPARPVAAAVRAGANQSAGINNSRAAAAAAAAPGPAAGPSAGAAAQ